MSTDAPREAGPGMTLSAMEQQLRYQLGTKLLVLVAVGGILLGVVFGVLGLLLVIKGSESASKIDLFGQSISTGSVGVAALFIAAVSVAIVVKRVLTSFDQLTQRRMLK